MNENPKIAKTYQTQMKFKINEKLQPDGNLKEKYLANVNVPPTKQMRCSNLCTTLEFSMSAV